MRWLVRLVTGLIGAVAGAGVGTAVGLHLKATGANTIWLAVICGSIGLLFGLVFRITP